MGIKSTLGKNLTGFLSLNNTSDIGTTADNVLPILASGGTGIQTTGDDGKSTNYHVFTEPGHFRLGPAAVGTGKTFTVLLVAGGGSGAGSYYAGGAGAGEVVYGADVEFPLAEGYEWKVEVGQGGLLCPSNPSQQYHGGTNGGDTRFYPTINYMPSRLNDRTIGIVTDYRYNVGLGSTGVIAIGGGGSGTYSSNTSMYGNHGGSAGGQSTYNPEPIQPSRYAKTSGRGYDHQYIYYGNTSAPGGSTGGGGGAGAIGSGKAGGAGKPFADMGSPYILPAIPSPVRDSFHAVVGPSGLYGGGGGAGAVANPGPSATGGDSPGGTGGGGAGAFVHAPAQPGVDFTGGGGGGGDYPGSNSGAGGCGIVIIKYINQP